MAFAVNHKEAGDGLRPKGEYECIIREARQTTTQNGTPCISIPLIVRNDVSNPSRGTIFHNLWMKKEPTAADNACEGYSAKQIQSISKAAGLPNGKTYTGINEWCDDLKGKLLRITINHEEYKGKTNARVQWINETKHPDCKHIYDAPTQLDAEGFTELDSDPNDVPF